MKNLLSRYRPRYVRSLVYMLQASEYDLRDYFRWYGRTRDFSRVEYRKRLVATSKASSLYFLAWIEILAIIAGVAAIAWSIRDPYVWAFCALVVIGIPFILAYAIALPLFLLRAIQWPIEAYIIARARRALQRHPALKIGIAGSFGKTSMREILKSVLAEGKNVAAPPGSWNTPLGISRFVESLTGDEQVLIFEFGEYYPGDIKTLTHLVQPHWGIITGINEAHLEKFGTLDQTTRTVFELAEGRDPDYVYVNGENEIARAHALKDHVSYTREGSGGWRVESAHTDLNGVECTMTRGASSISVKSRLLGLHMIGPLAAAADIASRIGLSPEQIQLGIGKTHPFEHRLEPHADNAGVTTLDDSYNGNPDGVSAVIAFLGSLSGHRRFYVTPGLVEMGSRKEAVHREIGAELARAGIEHVVLIRNSVTPFIEAGLKEAGYQGEVVWFDDAIRALTSLPQMTAKGDIVLIQNDWPDQYA
jgi:UDP-N-acetylmuramoyl-tripeptide--D-alanyl-D-alanine ligase